MSPPSPFPFQFDFLGNPEIAWAAAAGVALLLLLVSLFVKHKALAWLRRFAAATDTLWDDFFIGVASHTHWLVLLVLSAVAGSQFLVLAPATEAAVWNAMILAVWFQVGYWIHGGIQAWRQVRDAQATASPSGQSAGTSIITFGVRLIGWSVCTLMALSNLGVNITALVTGLGIGGLAVALAVQNILGDLFASLTIALDKPFEIGDFIILGDHMGTVEHVGLKTTRLRSLGGEQIIFANTDLLTSRVRNYKRMRERRIVFGFRVTHGTLPATLARIPDMVREAVAKVPGLRLDRAHFKGFGDSALEFEAVYFVPVPDYNAYMDAQQAINLALVERFGKEGIGFAFPTRTLHLVSTAAAPAAAIAR